MEEIRGDEYDTLKGKDNMQEQLFFMMKQATRSGLTTSTQQVAFLHLDVVDRQAPSQEQLCEGVNWILDKNKSGIGTVYVHCKAGRARSATLVAAYLMEVPTCHLLFKALPQVEGLSIEEAIEVVRQARPHIKLYKPHYEALETFHSTRIAKSTS